MEWANLLENKVYKDDVVAKVGYIKTDQIAADTYYFKPGQVLEYHRHPEGDQIFFVSEGEGELYLDDGSGESKLVLKPGVMVLAPKNVWHKIVNTGGSELIVSQATRQPAGMEKRT